MANLIAKIDSDRMNVTRSVSRQSKLITSAMVASDTVKLEITLNHRGIWQFEISDAETGKVLIRHTGENTREAEKVSPAPGRLEASIVTGKEPGTGDATYTVKFHEVGINRWTYIPGYTKDIEAARKHAHWLETGKE